ncbi:MAG: TMEM165/GDT1 family protein [Actinomycetota bacterium]
MLIDVTVSLGLVFVAEFGDKTQLVALTASARHGIARTMAIFLAALAGLQLLSVGAGSAIATFVPPATVGIAAGLMFIAFGVWTLFHNSEESAPDLRSVAPAGLIQAVALFAMAELGDKTMLTTAGLAADRSTLAVWIGSFVAMAAATGVAVVAGHSLAKRISLHSLRRFAAISFMVVGAVTLGAAAVRG